MIDWNIEREKDRVRIEYMLRIRALQRQIDYLTEELLFYKRHCQRPNVLKSIIHHPAKPRDSQCLYGCPAWDEYIYE